MGSQQKRGRGLSALLAIGTALLVGIAPPELTIIFGGSTAEAQPLQLTYEGCYTKRGPIPSIPSAVNDVAIALNDPRLGPIILFNPQVVQQLGPETSRFFYFHECAHHVLGHTLVAPSMLNEQKADCWAIRQLVGSGTFNGYQVNVVQMQLNRFARADYSHLPGEMRAINLRECLRRQF